MFGASPSTSTVPTSASCQVLGLSCVHDASHWLLSTEGGALFRLLMWVASPAGEMDPRVAAEMSRRKVMCHYQLYLVTPSVFSSTFCCTAVALGLLFAAVAAV